MQHSNSYEANLNSRSDKLSHRNSANSQKYQFLEKVGSGTYGVVYKAIDNRTQEVSKHI